jgi:hypothetical protein
MQGPWSGQYSSSQPIAPADNVQAVNCRAIFVTGAGNIIVKQGPIGALGPAETFAVTAGEILPIELNNGVVMATGTTATGLIALA